MVTYETSAADLASVPASYQSESRYLGYREADLAKPYAKFFREDVLPVQPHVHEALLAGMAPTEYGYGPSDAVRMLTRPGRHPMETGWTVLDDGTVMVSVLTDMPGVTGEMWDWWFGWHSCESARYKLWHPQAHQFSAVGQARSGDRQLTDRQRYIGNVSYVDEYVGGHLVPLAIRFVEPARMGFDDIPAGDTVIVARVGPSTAPAAFGWIVHQVRATDSGAEMRSRFFLNYPQHLDLPPASVAQPPAGRTPAGPPDLQALGVALLHHCAAEMNHLASFLPDLREAFDGTP
ncbi:DAPG hydrolase family protein [Streptomyces prunicolor]